MVQDSSCTNLKGNELRLEVSVSQVREAADERPVEAAPCAQISQIHSSNNANIKDDHQDFLIAGISTEDLRDIWNWNAVIPEACDVPVHELILDVIERQPDAIAINAWDGNFTYRELDLLSTHLAHHLVKLRVRRQILPLCFRKSKWVPIAMLAVMRAGAASLLLDCSHPEERLLTMIEQTSAPAMICGAESADLAGRLYSGTFIVVNGCQPAISGAELPLVLHSDPLYLLFTSGTTGRPKGVTITHGNFSSAIKHQRKFMFGTGSRVLDFASYAFDVAWSNLLFTLAGGACLCIPSEEERRNDLLNCIRRLAITDIDLTPSTLRLLAVEDLQNIQSVTVGGEQLHARDFQKWWAKTTLRNMYGPSECTPTTTMTIVGADTVDNSIGKGVGVCTWIVDTRGKLAPIGGVGELLLEGPLVGPGYLDSSATEAAYIENPLWLLHGEANHPGRTGRLYKTGDLVRYDVDGSLIYVGRKDRRVKINGQLAELTEIENEIREALQAVTEVVVDFVKPLDHSKKLLVAFLSVGADGQIQNKIGKSTLDLDDQLAKKLPSFMIPSMYIPLENFPVGATEKVDRNGLRAIIEERTYSQILSLTHTEGRHAAPASASEQQLQTLWASVLKIDVDSIGTDDSFLRIGGDSLGAMQLVAEARERGLYLTVADVMRHPRLRELAKKARSSKPHPLDNQVEPFSLLRDAADIESIRLQVGLICGVLPAQVQDVFPCTPLQEGLLALTARRKGDYVARHILELQPSVEIDRFKDAWAKVVTRTPILRTRFIDLPDQGLVQVVLEDQVPWILSNASDLISNNRPQQFKLTKTEDIEQQTYLGVPLVNFEFRDEQDGRRFFTWVVHHSLFDGKSIPLILQDLQRTYIGETLTDGPPFQAFIKHVLDIDQFQATSFWAQQFQDLEAPAFPQLPSPEYLPQARACVTRNITNISWPQLDVTASSILHAAWALVISHYSDSHDVVFGATSTGRQAAVSGIESIRGPVIATVPVRLRLNDSVTVEDFLQGVQAQAVEMTAFEQLGLQRIQRISPDAKRASQFQSLLVVQPRSWLPDIEAGILFRLSPEESDRKEVVMTAFYTYAVTLTCLLGSDGVDLRMHFDPDAFGTDQASRVALHMEHVLRQLCCMEKMATKVLNLKSVSDHDLCRIWKWNARVPATYSAPVHEWIADTVRARPHDLAIDAWDGQWTYAELDGLATKLAHHLLSYDINYQNQLVPLCFQKSKWMPVAMLAVMKSGGASVALEPSLPAERLRAIMKQVRAPMVLASPTNLDIAGGATNCRTIFIGDEEIAGLSPSDASLPSVNPSSMLYCVFTSGSTGTPKGVLVTHANFSSAIVHQQLWYGYGPTSRVYDFASYAFDAAWLNVLGTLCCGGCLCIPSDADRVNKLAESMQNYRVTHVDLTPSVARILPVESLQQLRTLIVSGEALQPAEACRWAAAVDLKNVYGPCECTPTATIATIDAKSPLQSTSIGKGIGVCTWVANGDKLVPIGGIGELLIEGPLVGMGYLGDAEKSAAVFIEDPLWLLDGASDQPGRRGRLYRTGDLVQYNEDGSLVFIGRTDMRVKIHGQLVELAEIEYNIQRYEHVRQVACFVPQDGLYAKRLVGVFSLHSIGVGGHTGPAIQPLSGAENSSVNHHTDAICRILDRTLPPYMVPTIWIAMRDIPLNSAGKLDRNKLSAWLSSISVNSYDEDPKETEHLPSRTAKQNDVETVLLDACGYVLDIPVPRLNCQKSFTGNGGDSISAMRLVSRCRAANIAISVAALLQNLSLAELSNTLTAGSAKVVAVEEDLERPFMLAPIQQWFLHQIEADKVTMPDFHYNQSFCLRIMRRVSAEAMSLALQKVVKLHPMLKIRFSQRDGLWMQHVPSQSDDLYGFQSNQVETEAEISALVSSHHRQINVVNGPVFFVDLIELPDGSQYLSLIAHHLVVDLVSWRIILDDLESLLESGRYLQEPLSFRTWNRMQIEKAATLTVQDQGNLLSTDDISIDLNFWSFDSSMSNISSDHQSQLVIVDEETTRMLLGNSNWAFHTETVDLLLAAIWSAFFTVFPERRGLTVWNEGHGREPWTAEIDLTKTVGWFTTISPIHMTFDTATELGELARSVKDARKRLPANGWAYFTSRYLSTPGVDMFDTHGPPVEVEFNYHGQFQQLEQEASLFNRVTLDDVADEGPQIPVPHLIGIEACIENKQANIAVSWNQHLAHQDRIKAWAAEIPVTLRALCDNLALRQPSKTLCDFPLLNLGYARLNELQQVLLPQIEAINNAQVADVFLCSPTVTGMLLSQSKQPQLYQTCEVFEIIATEGHLPSATSLAVAWQKVILRQPSLRSVFTPGLDHTAAFHQVILTSVLGEVIHMDFEDEEVAIAQLATMPSLECQQLKPPHRLTLCRLANDQSRIICQLEISHTITDATSSTLLMEDWTQACEDELPPFDMLTTCREVSKIISARAAETLSFWKQKMAGTRPCTFPRLIAGKSSQQYRNNMFTVGLTCPDELLSALDRLARSISVTSVSVYQAAWALTLASYCGTDSVCFGYLTSGRSLPIEGLDKCAGAFANMIVCRVDNIQQTSYRDLIQKVFEQMVQDLNFQHCHLAAIQHDLKLLQGQSLFNCSLNCQKIDSVTSTRAGERKLSFNSIEGKDPTEVSPSSVLIASCPFSNLSISLHSLILVAS